MTCVGRVSLSSNSAGVSSWMISFGFAAGT